jgi:hypothetical protein
LPIILQFEGSLNWYDQWIQQGCISWFVHPFSHQPRLQLHDAFDWSILVYWFISLHLQYHLNLAFSFILSSCYLPLCLGLNWSVTFNFNDI